MISDMMPDALIFNGAPVTQNGAPAIFNGALVTQNGAPVILNGAPKCSELKPVVVNGTTLIFDRVPDSLEGAPVTVNEAPNALDGRHWYKIPHLDSLRMLQACTGRCLWKKRLGEHSSSLGEHLERLGEHVLPQRDIKFHPWREAISGHPKIKNSPDMVHHFRVGPTFTCKKYKCKCPTWEAHARSGL